MLKRILNGLGAILSGQALSTMGNLFLVPLFLSHWTNTVYGEWMALSAVIAYLNVTDLGMNAAAGNKMLAAYTNGDWTTYRTIQASALAFYIVLAGAVTVASGIICGVFPIAVWLGIKSIPVKEAAVIAWMLASRTMWQMPVSQIANVYRTTGNLSATQWISNGQAGILVLVTAAVVVSGGGVFSVAVYSFVPLVISGAVAWWSVHHWRSDLVPHFRDVRLKELVKLVRPSLWFGLMILAIALSVQGPVVLVSSLLGGSAVALLVTTRTLSFLIRQVLGMVTAVLWPELTRLDAVGARESLRFLHRLLILGSFVVSSVFAGALWWEGSEVLRLWTRGRILSNDNLLRWFLISLVLQAPWIASAALTTATNRHRKLSFYWLTSSVISLVSCALLIRYFGILAVPLGVVIGEALVCYHFIIKDTCSAIGEDYQVLALRTWSSVVVVFVTALGAGWLGHAIAVGPSLLRWLEVGTLTTLSSLGMAWFVGISSADRIRLTSGLGEKFPVFGRRLVADCPQED